MLPSEYKDCDDIANIAEGKEVLMQSFKEAQDGFLATFNELKTSKDYSSPIEKHKILNLMFGLIQNINNISLQQHYIQTMADLMNSPFEVMYEQYKKFTKDEGRFTIPKPKKETGYQIDRGLLSASLFYENFIDQFIEDQELRAPLKDLVQNIIEIMPESPFAKVQGTTDESLKTNIAEMQLRREKELSDGQDEKKRYQTIKSTVSQIIHNDIQQLLKSKSISDDQKKEILKLKSAVE